MDTAAENIIDPKIQLTSSYENCTADLATDKANFASRLSSNLKQSGHPAAVIAAGKIDVMCAPVKFGATSMKSIDQCFRGTKSALQLFDARTQSALGAREWEGLRLRAQEIKTTGQCSPAYRVPRGPQQRI